MYASELKWGVVTLNVGNPGCRRLTHSKVFFAVAAGRFPTVAILFNPGGCMLIGGGVVDMTSLSNGVAGTAAAQKSVYCLRLNPLPLHEAEAIVPLYQHHNGPNETDFSHSDVLDILSGLGRYRAERENKDRAY